MPKTNNTDLEALSLDELRAKFQEVTGEETKDRSKARIIAKIEAEEQSIAVMEAKNAEPEAEPAPTKKLRTKAKAAEPADEVDDGEKKFSKMTVEELQAKHLELIGRPTTSSHKRYLIWRRQQASNGRIQTGPRAGRGNAGPVKVPPVRVAADAVEPLSLAQKRLELRSRNAMIVQALHDYLAQAGEDEVAAFFADPDAE